MADNNFFSGLFNTAPTTGPEKPNILENLFNFFTANATVKDSQVGNNTPSEQHPSSTQSQEPIPPSKPENDGANSPTSSSSGKTVSFDDDNKTVKYYDPESPQTNQLQPNLPKIQSSLRQGPYGNNTDANNNIAEALDQSGLFRPLNNSERPPIPDSVKQDFLTQKVDAITYAKPPQNESPPQITEAEIVAASLLEMIRSEEDARAAEAKARQNELIAELKKQADDAKVKADRQKTEAKRKAIAEAKRNAIAEERARRAEAEARRAEEEARKKYAQQNPNLPGPRDTRLEKKIIEASLKPNESKKPKPTISEISVARNSGQVFIFNINTHNNEFSFIQNLRNANKSNPQKIEEFSSKIFDDTGKFNDNFRVFSTTLPSSDDKPPHQIIHIVEKIPAPNGHTGNSFKITSINLNERKQYNLKPIDIDGAKSFLNGGYIKKINTLENTKPSTSPTPKPFTASRRR